MTFRLYRFDSQGNFEMFGNDHAEPFICRANTGEIIPIESSGFLIGIMENASMDESAYKFKLEKGDLLVFCSDGIEEAKNELKTNERMKKDMKEMMFGDKRLHELVSANREKTPAQLIELILSAVDKWMVEQEDDITMKILKMK
jgi:serine phosphatase RsbU (regulator of sigma subunit)